MKIALFFRDVWLPAPVVSKQAATGTCRAALRGTRDRPDWKYNPVIPGGSHGGNSSSRQADDAINGNESNRNCSTPNRWCLPPFCRKSRIDCPRPGMRGRWDGTDRDRLRWMPDDRFGFFVAFLLHFFVLLKKRETELIVSQFMRDSKALWQIQQVRNRAILLRIPNCSSVTLGFESLWIKTNRCNWS